MIRYPGSKDKIWRQILSRFPASLSLGGLFGESHIEYREPFFGAGAVGFAVIEVLHRDNNVWLNDQDYGMRTLWGAVLDEPEQLKQRVRAFNPTVAAFEQFKRDDGRKDLDPVETGFRKLALHQLSFSGLGAKAGGPIGGQRQRSSYNVDCRWNPSRLCLEIAERHRLLRQFADVKITAHDFGKVIANAPAHAFIYADPPYVAKGAQLYKHSMSTADHERLARLLRTCRAPWVLSYDDHPLVRDLYSWARIDTVALTYTTAIEKVARRKNSEVVITPKGAAEWLIRTTTASRAPHAD